MVNTKGQRMAKAGLVFWTLAGGVFYEFWDEVAIRNLFESLTFLIVGLFACLYIKTPLKYLWIFLLTWNVADEIAFIFTNDSFRLLAVIPLIYYLYYEVSYSSIINRKRSKLFA